MFALTPEAGPPGTEVTISGMSFGCEGCGFGATEVRFDGVSADFVLVSPFEISTSVPEGATTGFVTVRSVLVFTVTAP